MTRSRIELSATMLILFSSLFLVVFSNTAFWQAFFAVSNPFALNNVSFILAEFFFLVSAFQLLLSFFAYRYILRSALVVLMFIAAFSSYFMNAYGVLIDSDMIQNVMETDVREARELLTLNLFAHIALLGILPSFFILRARIVFRPLFKELLVRLLVMVISVAVVAVAVASHFKQFSITGREHKELRMMINPAYPIYAFVQYVKGAPVNGAVAVTPIASDAKQEPTRQNATRKKVLVLVVGETARASEFGINGYERDTTPNLAKLPIINFTNVSSCGTATAVSVPCMFSRYDRVDYKNKARYEENLLDVLQRSGVNVLWRDNNSGCKGVCDRVPTVVMDVPRTPDYCTEIECYDAILLKGLRDVIDAAKSDTLIVLHQKGSHGPAYYLRSPPEHKHFMPECTEAAVQNCSRQSIVNSYDNTIVYTDFFLSELIALLNAPNGNVDTGMLYVSDHGESLGENGVYLHGLPYAWAPKEQTHVPMIMWFAPTFLSDLQIDQNCLAGNREKTFSQDNIFHSMLGLFDISTSEYRQDHDIFAACRAH